MIYPDSPIFGRHIIAINGIYLRHGIGIENNLVVCPIVQSDSPFESQIQCLSLFDFSNGWELRYAQYQNNFNLLDVRNRAVNSIDSIDTYTFNATGDNFAIWCITGNHLNDIQANNPYFGQHLYIDKMFSAYQHHGIGIENGLVVHFNELQGEHVIHMAHYSEFSHGKKIEMIPYKQRFDPIQVRNLAINSIGVSGYKLFENNCEHFATWCLTGVKRCLQVEEIKGAIKTGIVTGARLAVLYTVGKLLEEQYE